MCIREDIEASIAKVQQADYEPYVELHHPSCPRVQPGAGVDTPCWGCC